MTESIGNFAILTLEYNKIHFYEKLDNKHKWTLKQIVISLIFL